MPANLAGLASVVIIVFVAPSTVAKSSLTLQPPRAEIRVSAGA